MGATVALLSVVGVADDLAAVTFPTSRNLLSLLSKSGAKLHTFSHMAKKSFA